MSYVWARIKSNKLKEGYKIMGIPYSRVKVVNPNEDWRGTECYINEQKIKNVKSVDFRVAVDEIPTFTFETVGMPDIDMHGQAFFQFTPQTVGYAAEVLRHEFKTNPESRKAFKKSIESVLKELPANEETWTFEIAEMIANRIIGIEN